MNKLENTSNRQILHSVITLAIPTVIEEILATLLLYVDTAMVGHLGEEATAAVNVTQSVSWLVYGIPGSIGVGVLSMIAQAVGSKDHVLIRRISQQVLLLVAGCGIIVGAACMGLSPLIPVWMGAEEAIRHDASLYFGIVSSCMLFRVSGIIFGAAIRATKDTRTPMLINLLANVMNVILNYLLIYVVGWGVRGAAVATFCSYMASGILMYIVYRRKAILRYTFREFRVERELLLKCARISVPMLFTSLASGFGYVTFASLVAGLGTTVFAAHSIAVTAEQIFYIAGYGVRTATSTLIGISIGEQSREKFNMVVVISTVLTVGMMCVNGGILFFFAHPLMSVFTNSRRVVELGTVVLTMVALSEPFFGLMIVMEGVFYGTGKTRHVFIVDTTSMWCVRILCTYLVLHVFGLGLQAVWGCMIADNICKAVFLSLPLVFKKSREKLFLESKICE